jgi:D-serine deaminase-like pyridoxal phosphate-dependent protein
MNLDRSVYELPREVADRLFSPSLVIYLDRVRANIECVLGLLGGDPDRWRPHVKTTKIPEVWRELSAAGVSHFKCATIREARVLARTLEGSGDILLAYPARGPAPEALGELAELFPLVRFSILSEDPAHVARVPANVSIFVDIDPGYHRTGIPLSDPDRIIAVAEAAGTRFAGVHHYEGHLTEVNYPSRRRRAFEGYESLLTIIAKLRRRGLGVPELVTSGTPGFRCALGFQPFAAITDTIHRVSPGTVVFHDLRSEEENPELGLVPAALLFSRVISAPTRNSVTCDAGSKSIAAEAGTPCAAVVGNPQLEAATPSEEHLPLRVRAGERPTLGSELYLVPRHVCPTVNLAEEALLVEEGEDYRTIPVAGRAHDVLKEGPGTLHG